MHLSSNHSIKIQNSKIKKATSSVAGMAYAAVISLKQTISGLLNSSPISSREILESAYNETISLQQVLERLNDSSRSSSERLEALDGKIRDCAHELEDILELYESDEEVRREITSFFEIVKKMEEEYLEELFSPVPDGDASALSNLDFGVEMVGQSSQFTKIRNALLGIMRPDDMCFMSYVGEVGSGRTIVAKTIFEDLCKEQQFFDCGAWVTVGSEYQLKEVAIRILVQVLTIENLALCCELLMPIEDEKICNYLYETLENRRYMIVLDDVRDVQVLGYLTRAFPQDSNGSLVFLTTNLVEVARSANSLHATVDASLRNLPEYDWFILRTLVFRNEPISPELEEAGKKIAENCGGRRISIAKTCLFLSITEKTPEQWSIIAADKENPIFMIRDEIAEICEIKRQMQSYNWHMDEGKKLTVSFMEMCLNFDDVIATTKMSMHPPRLFSRMKIISLLGMAGIGKSTYAKKLFKDESSLSHFDHRVWITLGPKYQAEQILIDILAQIYPSIDTKGDEKSATELCAQLSNKRCLIVLDDLWSKEPLHRLETLFPDIRGIALVTTRLAKVAKSGERDIYYEIPLLNKEESWNLLRQQVFAEGLCPRELEKAGRKIAEKCDGLPLLILAVADQLLKVEMTPTPEYWNNVASWEQNSVFKNAHDEISKALLPSYKSLPQHLKECFLYIGVFRCDYEIPTSKLTNLWIAEGFLEPNPPQIVQDFVAECLYELVDRSLVMVHRKVSDFQIKTCRLHSIFWHLSNSVAVKYKYFHAMNSYADCSEECMKSQRRLCIRNSILLGLKDVRNSMASIKSTHSLLCVSPPHQYPVPINFDLRLLRVMDALTIRLYEFPVEVVKLVRLRYLSLTFNGKIPTSISKLWKLQYLIVSRYISIKSSENDYSLLPVEIWDMKELKHLQIMGGCLPNPKCGASLLKLSTLLDVSGESCTKKVLKRIPNLKRLGIRIELAPDDGKGNGNPFRCLNRISRLRRLESLKCVVVNPEIEYEDVAPPPPFSMFPSSIKKLSLSGFGYPWEYMRIIGKLKNLEVLKLKRHAFRGPKWDMDYTSPFDELKFLLVEDTDLVHWEIKQAIFQSLERLSIKHCYELEELPTCFSSTYNFAKIEIVDCNPLVVTQAEQIRQKRHTCKVETHLSWIADDRH